jgi:hypothetical protein
MPMRILALILVVAIQAARVHAQHTEPGTGYWYEGVVTHGQGKATVASNEPRPLRQAMEALAELARPRSECWILPLPWTSRTPTVRGP